MSQKGDIIMQDTKTSIREFIGKFFQSIELTDDQDIFASGLVNSLFAMQLVLFVEKTFAIEIENEDLDIDQFRSLNAIAQLVERKQLARQQA